MDNQNNYQNQPNPYNQQPNPYTPQPPQYELPMNWFKFLIYFSLFASAVLNAINGITLLTGSAYGELKEAVYKFFDGLQIVDILVGLSCLAVAGFAIYTRMRLAGFYKNGPKMLNNLYISAAAINLIYVIAATSIVNSKQSLYDLSSGGSFYVSIAVSVVMVIANTAYFKKREHLFTK